MHATVPLCINVMHKTIIGIQKFLGKAKALTAPGTVLLTLGERHRLGSMLACYDLLKDFITNVVPFSAEP